MLIIKKRKDLERKETFPIPEKITKAELTEAYKVHTLLTLLNSNIFSVIVYREIKDSLISKFNEYILPDLSENYKNLDLYRYIEYTRLLDKLSKREKEEIFNNMFEDIKKYARLVNFKNEELKKEIEKCFAELFYVTQKDIKDQVLFYKGE